MRAACAAHFSSETYIFTYDPVIRATVSSHLSRNIVALQVETLCCVYYRVRDQLVSQQNEVLQVEATCCEN